MKPCPGSMIVPSGTVTSIVAGLNVARLHGIGTAVAEGTVVLVGMGIRVGGMIGVAVAVGRGVGASLVSSASIV